MFDPYEREIDYLRIAVTGSCNLSCSYCVGAAEGEQRECGSTLTDDAIVATVRAAAAIGFHKVRLTGGEPLLRTGLPQLVRCIKAIDGITEVNLTTNGTLLSALAGPLRAAGLDRINVSLDTLDPLAYKKLTGGNIEPVIMGIGSALEAGFYPIKVNMVVPENSGAEEKRQIAEMEKFCADRGLYLQKIGRYSLREMKRDFQDFERPPKCGTCNRLRITADGMLKPCLHSPIEVPLSKDCPEESLREAIRQKPLRGAIGSRRSMQTIGG